MWEGCIAASWQQYLGCFVECTQLYIAENDTWKIFPLPADLLTDSIYLKRSVDALNSQVLRYTSLVAQVISPKINHSYSCCNCPHSSQFPKKAIHSKSISSLENDLPKHLRQAEISCIVPVLYPTRVTSSADFFHPSHKTVLKEQHTMFFC